MFSFLKLVSGISLAFFLLNCSPIKSGDNDRDKDVSKGANTGGGLNNEPPRNYNEWIKLDNSLFGKTKPSFYVPPVVSHDNKWFYIATAGFNGGLLAVDVGDDFAASIRDPEKITKLTFEQPALNMGPGQNNFKNDLGQIRKLNAATDGLLIAWNASPNIENSGAIYVKGNKLELGWNELDIINFFAITKDGVDVPYIFFNKDGSRHLATQSKLQAELFKVNVPILKANFIGERFAQDNQRAYLLSKTGLSMLSVDKAGTNASFSSVDSSSPFGANKWRIDDSVSNDAITAMVVAKGIVFIGLATYGESQRGGVVVVRVEDESIISVDKSWAGIGVANLFVDNDEHVWATTPKGLIEVNPENGTMGRKLNAAIVAANQVNGNKSSGSAIPYKGEMPAEQIMSAIYVGKTLFLATTENAYIMRPPTRGSKG